MGSGVVVVNQPGVYLVDQNGNTVSIGDGTTITNEEALLAAGKDGGIARVIRVSADGTIRIDPTGTTKQPVGVQDWIGSTSPTVGQKPMGSSLPIAVASDQSPVPIATSAPTSTGSVVSFLSSGGSSDLVVDGSSSPVTFSFAADPIDDIQLSNLRLVFVPSKLKLNGNTFGKGGGSLSTGVSIDITANNGTFARQLMQLTINEDFFRLLDVQGGGQKDIVAGTIPFGGNVLLKGGSSDVLSVTIHDDLSAGNREIDYFTATAYGVTL